MSDENAEAFDPSSADMQINMFGTVDAANLTLKELAKPEVVAILISNQRFTLHDLKAAQKTTERLRNENAQLRESREELRVETARLREKANVAFLDVPIGILTGFAINILTGRPHDPRGWLMLVIGILMLIVLRASDIADIFGRLGQKIGRRKG